MQYARMSVPLNRDRAAATSASLKRVPPARHSAPVVVAFSVYLPDGRTRVVFKPPMMLRKGEEDQAVRDYLKSLDAEIASHPALEQAPATGHETPAVETVRTGAAP